VTKEEAKQKIAELVEKYQKLSAKEIKGFNEQATKQGFIEPMFRALGWDFENTNEVSPEEHASNGRVDYAFKLNNVSQFYIEAKSLKADLNREDFVKQAVSYSYARGVTWAVLTDFESLRVFNALKNTPFISLSFAEYIEKFDDLWLLSKQATAGNELSKKAQAYGAMPPFIPIEKRLFKQLSLWRENLFNEIYRYNEEIKLEREQVDSMIQKLFNRLIFMRTAEDRRIEENGLRALLNQWKTAGSKGYLIKPLRSLFNEYEGYYDSELFSLHLLDEDIFIDNESLQPVLEGLYEIPGSLASYNFNDIDADILGAVYEQYLGHIAEVVKQKAKEAQARMSLGIDTPTYALADKKERRKEHGIYYTPKYITDYIVKETVGKFLQENAGYPDKLRNLKILDPACGSGSFLIRAYDELLNYHANELKKPVHQLDQWERLPILTNNIFGVDLDKQAVEVARLNLLLRSLAKREPLPYLGNNIKNGNSLISGTEEELKKYFGDSWKDKNPFNWQDEFKDIIKNGGFDVVIGNPPYGIIYDDLEKAYFEQEYHCFIRNNDIFVAFMEKAIHLLKDGGLFAFIVPNTFLVGKYFGGLKEYFLSSCKIIKILNLGIVHVFDEPMVFNAIVIAQKENNPTLRENQVSILIDATTAEIMMPDKLEIHTRNQTELADLHWKSMDAITERIIKIKPTLGDIAEVKDIGLNYWTIGRKKTRGESIGSRLLYDGTPQHKDDIPFLKGRDIQRYSLNFGNHYLRHNYESLLDPAVDVFGYGKEYFDLDNKIVYRQTSDRIIATIDDHHYFVDKTLHIIVLKENYRQKLDIIFLLAILNSKLESHVYQCLTGEKDRLFAQVKTFIMKKIPIPLLDLNNIPEKKIHDSLVVLAENMLELNKKLHTLTEYEIDKKAQLEHEIKITDEKIDNLVYDLYGLTEEERKIVEGKTGKNV